MKHLAGLCLTSGLLIMAFAWGVAVSAMSENEVNVTVKTSTPNPCLYCHVDVHANWEQEIITPHIVQAPVSPDADALSYDPAQTMPTQVCLTCHTMMNASELPVEKIEAQINATRTRVSALQADLAQIYTQYPHWDIEAYRIDKTQEQIRAERISTLIAVIEADGSWGFHNPDYTEQILTEAEGLMAELLLQLGL